MRGVREKWKGWGVRSTHIRALLTFLGERRGEVSDERKYDYTMAIKR